MDRLQALLKGRKPPHPHVEGRKKPSLALINHASERAKLNNEDRKYNQIVYDNELKQANLYNQSAMPDTGKDIGVSFKINVYIIRLTQQLGIKQDLEKALSTFFATGVSVQRLRGATREAQVATDFFKKADILSTYNELMLYIKTYASDIVSDDAFKAQIFNTSFNPLIQLLLDTSTLYPLFFNQLPAPSMTRTVPPSERAEERKIYEVAREQSIGCYSLFNTMATFLNNLIFRPIVKDDISKYIKDNNVAEIFRKNPFVDPIAPIDPNVPQPQQGQQGQQGQPAPLDPNAQPQPPAQAVPANSADQGQINEIVARYMNSLQRILFTKDSTDALDAYNNAVAENYIIESPQASMKRKVIAAIKRRIEAVRGSVNLPVGASANVPQNIADAEQAWQQLQAQAQPAQPAPQPAPQPAQPQDPNRQAYLQNGTNGTQPLQVPELDQAESAQVWDIYKALETQLGAVISPNAGDLKILYDALPQAIQDKIRKMGTPDQLDEATAIQDALQGWVTNIMQQRQAWGNAQVDAQGQPAPVQSNTLYGLGREMNNEAVMNSILDFENMARRQAREDDSKSIVSLMPNISHLEPKIKSVINKLRFDRRNEPNSWGKTKYEYQQGIKQRAHMLPLIDEYDPKAEAFKNGKVMSGGCSTCCIKGGMSNIESDYSGYGTYDNEEDTPFKRMLIGMPNPFSGKMPERSSNPYNALRMNTQFDDEDDRDYFDALMGEEGEHYKEIEKPVDLDETADQIRKNNENYKVLTGKMKSVKYKN